MYNLFVRLLHMCMLLYPFGRWPNPATALQLGRCEDTFSLNFGLPGCPTHEGKFPTISNEM